MLPAAINAPRRPGRQCGRTRQNLPGAAARDRAEWLNLPPFGVSPLDLAEYIARGVPEAKSQELALL
jgi:hypothetical protein